MSTTLEQAVEAMAEAFVLADLSESQGRDALSTTLSDLLALPMLSPEARQVAGGMAELLATWSQAAPECMTELNHKLEQAIRQLQELVKHQPAPVKSMDLTVALAEFEQLSLEEPVPAAEPDLASLLPDLQARMTTVSPQDLAELASLHEMLGLMEELDESPENQKSIARMRELLESIILADAADPAAVLDSVRGLAARFADALPGEANATSEIHEVLPLTLPAAVDERMLADFLNRQPAVLEDLEAALLTRPLAPDAVAIVRRTLHTLKGECGLLGMSEISDLCHQAEEILEISPLDSMVDPLLEVKDWLERMFGSYRGRNQRPPAATELAILAVPADDELIETHDLPSFDATDDIFSGADESLLQDFIAESLEHLEASDQHLLQLETQPRNTELLNAVFRGFHTIKGVAGFLGLSQVQSLAHEAENLLDIMRRGELVVTAEVLRSVFLAVDALKTMIKTGSYPDGPDALSGLVKRIRETKRGNVQVAAPMPVTPVPADPVAPVTEARSLALRETLKVDAERLDKLIDTVGELVIAESMVSQSLAIVSGLQEQKRHQNNMSKITRELQEICMSLRMVPIRPTFQKMARVVHDLAHKLGKRIRFQTAGEDTELDKTVVDKVGDPLLHMVRNAVDHGIEDSPADRAALGKPEEATIELRAFHQGGSIFIEIRDDGCGLNRDAIYDKALAQGVISERDELSDRDLYMLIFEPGFSTRKQATDISGRGVGMDVVKRNIEGLRGRVDVQTEKGKGTTFTIKLPLTLAIIEGMLVRVRQERYAIPTNSILRTVSLDDEKVMTAMEHGRMLNLGDELLPLFFLHDLFQIDSSTTESGNLAIILENDGDRFAVVVDELLGQEQIVLKSLGAVMRGIPGLAGGAIMPDGQVGLIVDVAGLRLLAKAPQPLPISA